MFIQGLDQELTLGHLETKIDDRLGPNDSKSRKVGKCTSRKHELSSYMLIIWKYHLL